MLCTCLRLASNDSEKRKEARLKTFNLLAVFDDLASGCAED